ncbi:clustered mitochondria protein homolog [Trichomycterus rosablanca]|uniref:clustered mitochondria protein homolog n=1 Tax=Trichomycterus rosablanca TaxID=2290929 RepID=UPI002F353C29
MGNVFQCCLRLSHFFRRKYISDQTEDRSPLLSRENSDPGSLSPSRTSGDLLASPLLDQDHLLYPDIVLSSNHGAELDREDSSLLLELITTDRRRNQIKVNENDQSLEGCENDETEQMASTSISHQEFYCLERKQLSNIENEWPLLSSLQAWPSEQPNAANSTSQTLIYTYGQGTERRSLPCQAAKGGIQDEQKGDSHLAKETQETELNLVQKHQNVAQIGLELRPKWVFRNGVCLNQVPVEIAEDSEKIHIEESNQTEQFGQQIQSEQLEAQCRQSIAQQDSVYKTNEAVILMSHIHDCEEPGLEVKYNVEHFPQRKQHTERYQQEITQNEQIVLEQDFIQTDRYSTQFGYSVDQMAQTCKEQYISGNTEFEPTKQSMMEFGCHLDKQGWQKSEQLGENQIQSDRNLNKGSGPSERFTLFVVDKLFLATPGLSSENILSDQTDISELDMCYDKEILEDPDTEEADSEETGFTIRIQAPAAEPIEFQVSPLAMVQEIKQVLMDREETCQRTCFSLQLDGNTLDNFTSLKSISGLREGSLLRIVEEPYTVREVRLHLRHIRDLLKSLDPSDAYNGVEGSSLSFLRFFTEEKEEENTKCKKRGDELKQFNFSPPEYILPGTKERLLEPLQPQSENLKPTESLKVLMTSSWNPPPGNRKIHGDLMYLNVITMEDRHFSITASTRGFYINQSTTFGFNPKPASPSVLSHSLIELLSQISPVFKKNFSALLKKRTSTHPFERIGTPLQVFSWTARALDHSLDCVRAEDASSNMGFEEHLSGQQIRDWNEEIQSTRELPRQNVRDRLLRDRAIFKANSDFVSTATQGAMAVVDGNLMPINPSEEPQNHLFVWNNIFFSLGTDGQEHYEELGGEAAAHAASAIDLNGVRAYSAVDAEGLYVLGTVLVDYRGYRVTAQSIVPGILEQDQDQSVIYGSNDFGKTVISNETFLKLLDKPSKQLRIQRHQVLNKDGCAVELCSSVECKGILGNDGRHYILDLLFTFPPDLNFLPVDGEELNAECHQLGFPKQHAHRLACLRQELIEAFVKYRYHSFRNTVSQCLEQDDDNIKDAETHLVDHIPNAAEDATPVKNDSLMGASPSSPRYSSIDIQFNPDIFLPDIRFPKESLKEILKQKQLLKDAAAFLLSEQIPAFIRSCVDHTTMPMDGTTLTEALHHHGINIRYLGTLLEFIEKAPQRTRLDHVYRTAICELITRCTKHIFRTYLLAVEPSALSASVSHFLNCFLSSSPDTLETQQMDSQASKRRSRRRRSQGSVGGEMTAVEGGWSSLTSDELWRSIQTDALQYYHYCLPCDSIEQAVNKCGLQRLTLLREISIKIGIQILIREYQFDAKLRQVFTEEDILNIFPIIKHINPKANDGIYLLHCGKAKIQQGDLKEGCELISQALSLFTNVYGALHQDVCICLRLLGRVYYILEDYAEALSHQQKAVLISERVLGIEHPNTIQEYKDLGLYCFASGQAATALRLLYRARYLMLLVCGEDHPEMALMDINIGLMLHGVMQCDLALKFLENALALTSKYQGPSSLKLAQSHHLLAKVFESKGEFRSALRHEKERYMIYRSQVGEAHEKTQESSEYLKHLTNQAVILQRTMNVIYKNSSDCSIAPLKLSTPSRVWIVEQLNLVTGIVLIPLSNQDLETLRANAKQTAA